jgi:hypothetical protein
MKLLLVPSLAVLLLGWWAASACSHPESRAAAKPAYTTVRPRPTSAGWVAAAIESTPAGPWSLRGRAMLETREANVVIAEGDDGERVYARISVTPIVIADGDVVSVTPAMSATFDERELRCAAESCARLRRALAAWRTCPEKRVTRLSAVFDSGTALSTDDGTLAVPPAATRLISIALDLGEPGRGTTLTWEPPGGR